MNVDPNKVVAIELPAGVFFAALAALGKMPYEQVAQPISMLEQSLHAALNPAPPAEKPKAP
jgi:hypothetical protein